MGLLDRWDERNQAKHDRLLEQPIREPRPPTRVGRWIFWLWTGLIAYVALRWITLGLAQGRFGLAALGGALAVFVALRIILHQGLHQSRDESSNTASESEPPTS